ncbi:MAG: hypothetical protein ACO3EY_07325 [Candidatus Nanopelagicales bacterium]|jgi:hypothetical protein
MIKFSQFLNEAVDSVVEVDSKWLENNLESINAELDKLTEKPYQNAPIMLTQLRGFLERYGMLLPQSATPQFMNLSAEVVYALGDSPYNLYIVYDTNDDGFVDGYASVVTDEELDDLMDLDTDELIGSDRDPITMRPSTWYAAREDDGGNTDEY